MVNEKLSNILDEDPDRMVESQAPDAGDDENLHGERSLGCPALLCMLISAGLVTRSPLARSWRVTAPL